MSAPTEFSRLQIILHWIVALLVIVQTLLHEGIVGAWDVVEKGGEMVFSPIVISHIVIGDIVFFLIAWRLLLRIRRGAPEFPSEETGPQKLLAKLVHGAFYLLLIIMPISGGAAVFGGVMPAAEGHELMAKILIILVILHVLATIYHQFVLKTNLIQRMKF